MTSEMRIHFNKRIYRVSHIPCPISWCKDNNNWSGGDCGALCKCAPFLVLTKSQLEFFKSFNKITYLTLLDAGLSFTNYFATRINTPYIQCQFNILTLLQCIMSLYLVFLIRSINRWLKSIRWSVGWLAGLFVIVSYSSMLLSKHFISSMRHRKSSFIIRKTSTTY